MELTQLLNSVHAIQVVGQVQRKDVASIVYDSRKVKKNSLFVAIKGFNADGHKFILDAINKGALAIVLEDNNAVPEEIFSGQGIAKILVKDSRVALAELSNYFFKQPSKKIKLIGITGTNGKTTTSYFIKNILETTGNKTGVTGTIANYIGNEKLNSTLTTPESNDMNELLLEMYNKGCRYAVMEASSHSLFLKRTYDLNFAAAVFTNITSDHLDFHENFENYLNAKKILFDSLNESAIGIYNLDDKNSSLLIKDSRAALYSYGMSSNADFILKDIKYDLNGTNFIIERNGSRYQATTTLVGEFNAYNAGAAFAVTVLLGIDEEKAIEGIKNTGQVSGRFEIIGKGSKKVIVDYSHTADSLEKTLLAIKKIVKDENPVYTVFGCGGNRDKTKRPVMGRIAAKYSRKAIITSDNPRFENPSEIINEIKKGIPSDNYEVIENREEAIKKAIETSEENAVILVAGKGHESYQEIKGVRKHFSDQEVARKYL
jgi:UDP-N-acetylmuramoyl-L-alanyl-D-glutamate--2,6-diaminopimelate ligase